MLPHYRRFEVTVRNPAGSFEMISSGQAYSGGGLVIVGAGHTPIARIHGAYAQKGVGPAELATVVGRRLLESSGVEAGAVSDLVIASSVPDVSHTFLPTTVRRRLDLEHVDNPTHVGTLCTGGATAIKWVHESLCFHHSTDAFGMAIGADDQSLGQIMLHNRFREILGLVTGRPLPMEFSLDPQARETIPPEQFLEAVRIFVEERGSLRGIVTDGILLSFNDTTGAGKMWDTAARVALHFDVSDEEAAQIAVRSHRNYWEAADRGVFDGIVATVPEAPLAFDENPSRRADPDRLTRGRTARGVHSGTSSQMGGGAAGVLLTSKENAFQRELCVLAEIVAYSFSQVDPTVMGLGPISATKGLLDFLGLGMDQMGFIEVNEAFAAVVSAFLKFPDFGFGYTGANATFPSHVNPWGGAIAKGHVMGSKFLELVNLAVRFFELNPDKEYALVTLCGGGGQGAAMVLRNPRFIEPKMKLRILEGPRGFVPIDEKPLAQLLSDRGRLPVGSMVADVDKTIDEATRLGRILPAGEDLDYVLARSGGVSLSNQDLIRKATEYATIKAQSIPGSSETNGELTGVIGAGEMGAQVAYNHARDGGYEVYLADKTLELAEKGWRRVAGLLYDAVQAGLHTAEEAARILARIHITDSMPETVKQVQGKGRRFEMILEVVDENLERKQGVFQSLRDAGVDAGTILASNTSSFSAVQIGCDAVFHYFNPIHAMGLIDGTFADDLSREKRDRLKKIADNVGKVFHPADVDAPAGIGNPYFVASYFTADLLPPLAEEILAHLPADAAGDDVTRRAMAKKYAMALLEALYIEAIKSEPEPLGDFLKKRLDLDFVKKEIKSSGALGLFRLIDVTGGPHTFVVTAENVARFYGSHLEPPQIVKYQLADWEQARADGKPENARRWFQDKDGSPSAYARFIREGVSALEAGVGEDFISRFRETHHREFWAHVMSVMGTMHDRGVVPVGDPSRIDESLGSKMGLSWRSVPERWLRAQGSMQEVTQLLTEQGIPVPGFFSSVEDPADLPRIPGILWGREMDGKMVRIRFNRPRSANAVDQGMLFDLRDAANAIAADPKVSVTVLEGKKSWVGGADIKWFAARQAESARLKAEAKDLREHGRHREASEKEAQAIAELAKIYDEFSSIEIAAMERLNNENQIIVAIVSKDAFGGGVEMAAQADIVIVAEGMEGERTQFVMPERTLGIGIGYGAHINLVKKVGLAHAKRILLTGGGFRATEALAIGFADRVVRRHDLPERIAELTRQWEEAKAAGTKKEDFIKSWTGERPKPPEKMALRLAAQEKLWSDTLAASTMALGQVPDWLEGEQKKLAEEAVKAIRRGSPEAVALLHRMVNQRHSRDFSLREALIRIFDSENARAGIGAFARGERLPTYRWSDVENYRASRVMSHAARATLKGGGAA